MKFPLFWGVCLVLGWHYVSSAPANEPPEEGVETPLMSIGLILLLAMAVVTMMKGRKQDDAGSKSNYFAFS